MQDRIVRAATVVAAAAALVIAAVVVRNANARGVRQSDEPLEIAEWQRYGAAGHGVGPSHAPVTVVVFSDFQCPFCRRFSAVVDSLHARRSEVRIVERHLPLTSIHPEAYNAALAAECGAASGAYAATRNALYRKRVAVEDADWGVIARTARVSDTTAFVECVASRKFAEHVERDVVDAETLGLRGTPAVLVNGLLYRGALTLTTLEEAVNRADRIAK